VRRSGLPLTDLLGQKISSTLDALVAQADYIYLGGRSVAVLNGSTPYYLHTDRLGTPQLATDSNESVAWLASYDSFGQASVSGTVTQNLRFPGQYFDLESGWNHNGFRDYAPTLGGTSSPIHWVDSPAGTTCTPMSATTLSTL
jgi:uncharacterized protein RhaS with RHS repeats